MAEVWHCGSKGHGRVYRLSSSKPVYCFQHLAHLPKCKRCGKEVMQWRGEYLEGDKFTFWVALKPSEFPAWHRRIRAGEAKPEAQLTSEWTQRAARPADIAFEYHERIRRAQARIPRPAVGYYSWLTSK